MFALVSGSYYLGLKGAYIDDFLFLNLLLRFDPFFAFLGHVEQSIH